MVQEEGKGKGKREMQSRALLITVLVIFVNSIASAESLPTDGSLGLSGTPDRDLPQVKPVSTPDRARTGT